MRNIFAATGASILAFTLAGAASAQSTFHVKEFDYQKGDWTFETINAYQGGFTTRSDRVQMGHELGIGYAVTDWWQPKVLIAFDKDEGRSYEVQRVLMENVLKIKPLAENADGIGFALFHSVEGAVNSRQTNATAFGPIITAQAGKFSISTNTFFEKTFGQNREQGMNFLFAWQARYEVMDKFKIGLEGYGLAPELGASHRTPLTGFQHRIGPVLIFEVDLPGQKIGAGGAGRSAHSVKSAMTGAGKADAPHAEIEVGVLFGTTDYTPDVTGKVNMHISF